MDIMHTAGIEAGGEWGLGYGRECGLGLWEWSLRPRVRVRFRVRVRASGGLCLSGKSKEILGLNLRTSGEDSFWRAWGRVADISQGTDESSQYAQDHGNRRR
eukprot:685864-Amorphochlora_amoeboformis.AAC.1